MNDASIGRLSVMAAVIMMAAGKVAYGTWLIDVPSPIYVLFCFSLVTAYFLPVHGRETGEYSLRRILLLNGATALCFLFFFYGLKLVEPAVAGAVQFGTGPLIAMLIALVVSGAKPTRARALVSTGLLAACVVLAISAVTGAGFASDAAQGWIGLAAILMSAVGSVLITVVSKDLSLRGWSKGAILAHRCYLILPMALVLVFLEGISGVPWSLRLALTLLGVGTFGTIIPLVLLQNGIEKSDPHTVLVMLAAMPIVTFVIEGLSPLYVWSWLTAAGLALMVTFIALDVVLTAGKPLPQVRNA